MGVGSTLSNKIWGLDFLRSSAKDDKDRSVTRLILTLILLIGTVACFVILIIWKLNNLGLVINTITPKNSKIKPSIEFKDYLKKENESSLSCVSTKKVYFGAFVHPANSSITLDDLLEEAYKRCDVLYPDEGTNLTDYLLNVGCANGAYAALSNIVKDGIPSGSILSHEDLTTVFIDSLFDATVQQFLIDYSSWRTPIDNLQKMQGLGYIKFENVTSTDGKTVADYFKEIENVTDGGYYDAVENGAIDNMYNLTIINYQEYFEAAKVVSCQYYSQQGAFDVFQYASTLTATVFGWTVIVLGILLGIIKYIQHRRDQKNPADEVVMTNQP